MEKKLKDIEVTSFVNFESKHVKFLAGFQKCFLVRAKKLAFPRIPMRYLVKH